MTIRKTSTLLTALLMLKQDYLFVQYVSFEGKIISPGMIKMIFCH
jgi:hypothetical protein